MIRMRTLFCTLRLRSQPTWNRLFGLQRFAGTGLKADSLGEAPDTPNPKACAHLQCLPQPHHDNESRHFISAVTETNHWRLALSPVLMLFSFRGSAALAVNYMVQ